MKLIIAFLLLSSLILSAAPATKSQVPRFQILESANVVLLAAVRCDADFVYVTAREVWRGAWPGLSEAVRIPQRKKSPLRPADPKTPWLCVVSFQDYPHYEKGWGCMGSDGERLVGLDHPTIAELREYFKNHAEPVARANELHCQ